MRIALVVALLSFSQAIKLEQTPLENHCTNTEKFSSSDEPCSTPGNSAWNTHTSGRTVHKGDKKVSEIDKNIPAIGADGKERITNPIPFKAAALEGTPTGPPNAPPAEASGDAAPKADAAPKTDAAPTADTSAIPK